MPRWMPKTLLALAIAITLVVVISIYFYGDWNKNPQSLIQLILISAAGVLTLVRVLIDVLKGMKDLQEKKLFPSLVDVHEPRTFFTGRDRELNDLENLILSMSQNQTDGVNIVVTGCPGIGKTTLAYHLIQRISKHFPDARLERSLQNPNVFSGKPLDPYEVMQSLLLPFYPSLSLPEQPEELRALYLKTLRDKKCIILLENAVDAKQITPMLVPSPSLLINPSCYPR